MARTTVTVAVPTLAADEKLLECVRSLKRQTLAGVEVIVVDNSGCGKARLRLGASAGVRILENKGNMGFGAAVNRAFREAASPFVATLNDDAVAAPEWLEALVGAMDAETGMCASQVVLTTGLLDSAGMRIAPDGSSRQRGHGSNPLDFSTPEEVLLPSGSAALYRREVIEDTEGFDEDFFLYCEDTDLGLRARWAGWKCRYVPTALVKHHFSHTTGPVSTQKAYFVERNRLFLALKTLPLSSLPALPFHTAARYFWHFMLSRGMAARYRREGGSTFSLIAIVLKAHWAAIASLPLLMAKRRLIKRRISTSEFCKLLKQHRISVREVAAL